jgi:hypothetical protein
MRKQVLLIGVFAILLSGCNGQDQQPADDQMMAEEENVTPVVEEETTTNTETVIGEASVLLHIQTNEDFNASDCDSFTKPDVKNKCLSKAYLKQATEEGKRDLCNEIPNEDIKQECFTYFDSSKDSDGNLDR